MEKVFDLLNELIVSSNDLRVEVFFLNAIENTNAAIELGIDDLIIDMARCRVANYISQYSDEISENIELATRKLNCLRAADESRAECKSAV